MACKASGERQVAEQVTPMRSGLAASILRASSPQGSRKVVQSRISTGNAVLACRYAATLSRPKEGVHILRPGKSLWGGSTRKIRIVTSLERQTFAQVFALPRGGSDRASSPSDQSGYGWGILQQALPCYAPPRSQQS